MNEGSVNSNRDNESKFNAKIWGILIGFWFLMFAVAGLLWGSKSNALLFAGMKTMVGVGLLWWGLPAVVTWMKGIRRTVAFQSNKQFFHVSGNLSLADDPSVSVLIYCNPEEFLMLVGDDQLAVQRGELTAENTYHWGFRNPHSLSMPFEQWTEVSVSDRNHVTIGFASGRRVTIKTDYRSGYKHGLNAIRISTLFHHVRKLREKISAEGSLDQWRHHFKELNREYERIIEKTGDTDDGPGKKDGEAPAKVVVLEDPEENENNVNNNRQADSSSGDWWPSIAVFAFLVTFVLAIVYGGYWVLLSVGLLIVITLGFALENKFKKKKTGKHA